MMREILFHGKRLDNGEWVEGLMYQISDDTTPFIMLKNKHAESHQVDPATVGQYTGLTDKNGKRIFEGDIVICRQGIEGNHVRVCIEIGFVEMKFGAFGLHRKQGYYRPFKDWLEDYEYEIIGNIHDNPELMEVGN